MKIPRNSLIIFFIILLSIIFIYNYSKSNYEEIQYNLCEKLGDKCVFKDWDDCVTKLNTEIDPSVANPNFYDQDRSLNYYDVAQTILNGEMNIVDQCAMENTDWNANPRCKIKKGKYAGQIGVCVYNGDEIQDCQPVGQKGKIKLRNFCPDFHCHPVTGECTKTNLMCKQVGDKVFAECA